jgi:hypothetical protein
LPGKTIFRIGNRVQLIKTFNIGSTRVETSHNGSRINTSIINLNNSLHKPISIHIKSRNRSKSTNRYNFIRTRNKSCKCKVLNSRRIIDGGSGIIVVILTIIGRFAHACRYIIIKWVTNNRRGISSHDCRYIIIKWVTNNRRGNSSHTLTRSSS